MSSILRISGLASGMDIDQMVTSLMKAQRTRVDKIKQDKQIAEWQREDYREINNLLRSLRDSAFNMKLQSGYLAKKAASSNETIMTVSANPTAASGIYSVTVQSLAAGVSKGSQSALPEEANADGTTKKLSEQFEGLLSGTISFELSGSKGSKSFSIDTASKTIYDVVSEINSANLGITASYDKNLNRFFLNTDSTGSGAFINVTGDSSNFLSDADGAGTGILKLNLQTGTAAAGTNAIVDFGDAKNLEFSTNTFTISGITITAKKADPASRVDVTVSADTDSVYNTIKSFVDLYNSTIEKVNGKLTEERYKDYLPLTDDQREKLTEDQQKKWEEKARSGLLRRDPLLESAIGKMRATMAATVPGAGNPNYDTLAEIGITTGNYSERGKLHLDEAKLKDALNKDPQAVMELFTKPADTYGQKGIAARLYDDLTAAMKALTDKAGLSGAFSTYDNSVIGKRITELDKSISTWENRLTEMEDRYYKQFTAMEEALSKLNSQSAWLSQMLSGSQS
ncbi:MAG: flagellar filament capping protein FliD [Firmicutes bacterium]|nr:flagellar filament capping protein FliD [Bacillota bacterium]